VEARARGSGDVIVREITRRGGTTNVRLVDYKTGQVISDFIPRERVADAWVKHYSFSLGARTKRHEKELAQKITEAGVPFSGFDAHSRLKVDSPRHQLKLAKVVLGPDYVNKDGVAG
jgi:hypothetical protein